MQDKGVGLHRSITMLVLGSAGTTLFLFPFLHEIYYDPMRLALGQTNVQIGSLSSAYGLASLIGYVPGGWLADKFKPRTLLPIGLIGTGIGGAFFASFPSYPFTLLLYVLWGAMTVVCWSTMIRATREWAAAGSQGRAFGLLESVRGVTEGAIGAAGVAVFAWAGSTSGALSTVIVGFAVLNIALGIIAFFTLDRTAPSRAKSQAMYSSGWRELLPNPDLWLISLIVLSSYTAYTALYYFTPYSSSVLQLSVAAAGAIAVGKIWLKPFAAIAAGFAADRWGVWQTVVFAFAILVASMIIFALFRGTPKNAPIMIANLACASLAVFAIRGVYFALIEECRIPESSTGSATGLISLVGFTPDIFVPPVAGYLLDSFPGESGYRMLFGIVALACATGLATTAMIGRRVRSRTQHA